MFYVAMSRLFHKLFVIKLYFQISIVPSQLRQIHNILVKSNVQLLTSIICYDALSDNNQATLNLIIITINCI